MSISLIALKVLLISILIMVCSVAIGRTILSKQDRLMAYYEGPLSPHGEKVSLIIGSIMIVFGVISLISIIVLLITF